jgi:hypothetical protein
MCWYPGSNYQISDSSCNIRCPGNSSQICGGISNYSSHTLAVHRTPQPEHWNQVSIGPLAAGSIIENTNFIDGGGTTRGDAAMVESLTALSITGCSFLNSSSHGLVMNPLASPNSVTITNSVFRFNTLNGLILTGNSCLYSCAVDTVTASDNGFVGIHMDSNWLPSNNGPRPTITSVNAQRNGLAGQAFFFDLRGRAALVINCFNQQMGNWVSIR